MSQPWKARDAAKRVAAGSEPPSERYRAATPIFADELFGDPVVERALVADAHRAARPWRLRNIHTRWCRVSDLDPDDRVPGMPDDQMLCFVEAVAW